MWYNVAVFLFGVLFVIVYTTSGNSQNKKGKRLMFYTNTIIEREQEMRDQEVRAKQKEEEELRNKKALENEGTTDAYGQQ